MGNVINYNSWEDKAPFGALSLNQDMRISVRVSDDYEISNISWVIMKENVEIVKTSLIRENKKYYQGEFNGFNEVGVYFYYFEVDVELDGVVQTKYYGKNMENGESCEYLYEDLNKYQITVYKDYEVPKWYKEGILYHIFVDRFNNGNRTKKVSNPKKNSFIYANWDDDPMYIKDNEGNIVRWDFYGGNLKGIIDKLGYLKKLGVSIIYLSPIFEASSNHKYDTGDYKKIDAMFGDEEIFRELLDKASKKGIHIILDGVFSHTGSDSIYFNKYNRYSDLGAYQSEESKYNSWYKFNNYPEDYDCWWGVKSLPNVNELDPTYIDYIIKNDDSVLKKWTTMGVKGWRLDVADELPEQFIKEFKKELKDLSDDNILIGEVWEDASNKISYNQRREYLLGEQLDSVMGYPFRTNIVSFLKNDIKSIDLLNRFMQIKENYPSEAFKSNLNLIGSHDVKRIKTELDEDKELVKLAVGIQMTFEGIPYIYYGDEAGICGNTDPDNRRTYPWKKEDEDMIEYYRNLTTIRKKYKALIYGETSFIDTKNADVFAFIRKTEEEKLLIVVNRSENENDIKLHLDDNTIEEIDIESNLKKYIEDIFKDDKNFEINIKAKTLKVFNLKNLIG
ncbi:glycoside hydrolase family 13 protein [Romboutsia lituseburensis]|uniref:Glycosidase n=1 Tax=Romboutsia lituseburensis DSM 797 TaxID=1121325 RepID=A0A1G9SMN9_9FIRM|nr:glycoside hydrolase family 13 protein [Romboutsia lituseburensis]CEH32974.1 Amylopullulanase [Romboutsia lituseburensis]SDM36692.1 Glycosidase [Romboutsia lituseburensis DSM 797]